MTKRTIWVLRYDLSSDPPLSVLCTYPSSTFLHFLCQRLLGLRPCRHQVCTTVTGGCTPHKYSLTVVTRERDQALSVFWRRHDHKYWFSIFHQIGTNTLFGRDVTNKKQIKKQNKKQFVREIFWGVFCQRFDHQLSWLHGLHTLGSSGVSGHHSTHIYHWTYAQ